MILKEHNMMLNSFNLIQYIIKINNIELNILFISMSYVYHQLSFNNENNNPRLKQ